MTTPSAASTGRRRLSNVRPARLFTVVTLALVALGVGQSATAAPGVAATGFTTSGGLSGVAAVSAVDAWAVGSVGSFPTTKTLIVHWNGTAWRRVSSPSPGPYDGLLSVAGTSASDVWAVGYTGSPQQSKTLILHWNGTVWKRVPSPSPGTEAGLHSVAATSASNVWAVGSTGSINATKTLILHWNGTAWKRVPSPVSIGLLLDVKAPAAGSAWAVGDTEAATGLYPPTKTLIERWNGKAWARVASPSPGVGQGGPIDGLSAVVVLSGHESWAFGFSDCGCGPPSSTLLERWQGKTWQQVPFEAPGGSASIEGATATSAHAAWAVGVSGDGDGPKATLTLYWNGTTWRRVPSPSPGYKSVLKGVSGTSPRNVWAVGEAGNNYGTIQTTVILHWNGTTWK
jgi:hypothetical protein